MQGFLLKNYKDVMIEIDVKYIAELNGIQKGFFNEKLCYFYTLICTYTALLY